MGVFKAFHAAHERDLVSNGRLVEIPLDSIRAWSGASGSRKNLVAVFVGEAVDLSSIDGPCCGPTPSRFCQ